eukprot:g5158.t1
MICEVQQFGNFFSTYVALNVIALAAMMLFSGFAFYKLYWRPTFEIWQYKTNEQYPSPAKVKQEIVQMLKGLAAATLCPTLSLWLAQKGYSQAYCGLGDYSWAYLAFTFVFCWVFTDFFEFYYHRLGHCYESFWNVHKHHHVFFNPTPFAVIADEYIDQFVRSSPLVILPLMMPVNIDLVFFQYAIFFYGYGVFLHLGYEFKYPSARHPWINTSYHHYVHHAKSIVNKCYHTGFFLQCWDQLFGSIYPHDISAQSKIERGERTRERFDQIEKPDYSVLFQPGFWLTSQVDEKKPAKKKAAAGKAD